MLSSLALVVAAAAADPASTTLLAPATMGARVAASTAIDSSNSVSLETKDRQLLSASFYEPKRRKSSPPAPAAMLIHDAGSSRDELAEMAAYLSDQFCTLPILLPSR